MLDSCMFVSDLNPGDCAAWVQAIGSVLAIVAAAFFIWLQHYLDDKRERETEHGLTRRRLDVVAGAISSAQRVHLRDGLPIKEIERHTGLARNTIKVWLRKVVSREMV